MYSLSDHYIFSETIIYDAENQQIGREVTTHDITPIYMIILILIFYFILNEICRTILYKVKKHIEIRNQKKRDKTPKYEQPFA